MEGFGKFFDDRGLSGAADCQVTDTNNEAPELPLFENSFAIQVKAGLHNREIEKGKEPKGDPQQRRTEAVPLVEDDFDRVLFKFFQAPRYALFL